MTKKGLVFLFAAAIVLSLAAATWAFGPDIIGHMGRGGGAGPGMTGMMGGMMGSGGSGMMGSGGYGMMGSGGSGMMGPGSARDFAGHPCWDDATRSSETALNKENVTSMANAYLTRLGNPNLKLGEVKELENEFQVSIVTKENSLVNKFSIDKKTGLTKPVE